MLGASVLLLLRFRCTLLLNLPQPQRFPYTPLFRSRQEVEGAVGRAVAKPDRARPAPSAVGLSPRLNSSHRRSSNLALTLPATRPHKTRRRLARDVAVAEVNVAEGQQPAHAVTRRRS